MSVDYDAITVYGFEFDYDELLEFIDLSGYDGSFLDWWDNDDRDYWCINSNSYDDYQYDVYYVGIVVPNRTTNLQTIPVKYNSWFRNTSRRDNTFDWDKLVEMTPHLYSVLRVW